MATYLFENQAGDVIEKDFPMKEVPQSITVNGRKYKKILSPSAFTMKFRHRALGEDEDRAFKAAAQDMEQSDRDYEMTMKNREKAKAEGVPETTDFS